MTPTAARRRPARRRPARGRPARHLPRARVPRAVRAPAGGRRSSRGRGERGVTAVEFAGWLPLLILVALAALQLGFIGYAAQQASSGARAAARVAAQDEINEQYASAGRAAISDWLSSSFSRGQGCDGSGVVTVTAQVEVPSVLPFMSNLGQVTKSVSMPCD